MKMHKINFSDEKSRMVIDALDFYSRIWIGQYDHILWELRWMKNCGQLDALDRELRGILLDMRNIILPGLCKYGLSGSYGIFSPKRDIKAAIAYDMQQEYRYKKAWHKNPEGGITVDFGRPLPCEDDPCDFPKAECHEEHGSFYIEIMVDDVQLGVMLDALTITVFAYSGQIDNMFAYYTQNEKALRMAKELTDKLLSIETEYVFKDKPYKELIKRLEMVQKA